MSKKLSLIAITLLTTIFLTACGNTPAEDTENTDSPESQATAQTEEKEAETKPKTVEVFTIGANNPATTTPKPEPKKVGTVHSAQKVIVKAETGGKLDGFAVNEGEQIAKDSTLATLGRSLQADINELNYLNALTALKNAEAQLTTKQTANQKSVENATIAVEQAQIQLESALKSKDNINRSANLGIRNLNQQNRNSFSNITERLRDVAAIARSANNDRIEYRLRAFEDSIDDLFYRRQPNTSELSSLLNEAEVILSELKGYDIPRRYAYDRYDYDSSYNYDRQYDYENGAYRVIYNDGAYYPAANDSGSNTITDNSDTNGTNTGNEAIQTRISQLLPQIQADQAALLQTNQGFDTAYDNQITQNTNADTQIDLAQTQLKNAQQLFEMRIDQVKLEEQSLADQIEQLQGQLAIAGRNRDTRNITSPIEGTVLNTLVEPGEMINPGQAIAEIGNLNALEVKVAVTQIEAANLKPYQPVLVTNTQGDELPGFIAKLPTNFDPQTKTGEVEIIFDHKAATSSVKPGGIVSVQFQQPRDSENITATGTWIPLKSVYFQKDTFVYLNLKGKATKHIVTTGKIEGNLVEIKSGLKKNDEVITTRYGIQEDEKVTAK